jgi:hypothetical protein
MRIAALVLCLAALSACASYQPPEANCFAFAAAEEPCTFTPLEAPGDG